MRVRVTRYRLFLHILMAMTVNNNYAYIHKQLTIEMVIVF